MPPLQMLCVHCGQVLEPKRDDGPEVCRFCVKQFKKKCIACANDMAHRLEPAR